MAAMHHYIYLHLHLKVQASTYTHHIHSHARSMHALYQNTASGMFADLDWLDYEASRVHNAGDSDRQWRVCFRTLGSEIGPIAHLEWSWISSWNVLFLTYPMVWWQYLSAIPLVSIAMMYYLADGNRFSDSCTANKCTAFEFSKANHASISEWSHRIRLFSSW